MEASGQFSAGSRSTLFAAGSSSTLFLGATNLAMPAGSELVVSARWCASLPSQREETFSKKSGERSRRTIAPQPSLTYSALCSYLLGGLIVGLSHQSTPKKGPCSLKKHRASSRVRSRFSSPST